MLYLVLHAYYVFIKYIFTSVHHRIMFVLVIYPEFRHQ